MGKFESELHTLCEQSKWEDLCLILEDILEAEQRANQEEDEEPERKEGEEEADLSARSGSLERQHGSSRGGSLERRGEDEDDDDDHHLHNNPYSQQEPLRSTNPRLYSSVSNTATTAPSSTALNDLNDSSHHAESFEEDLKCSYEKLNYDAGGIHDNDDDDGDYDEDYEKLLSRESDHSGKSNRNKKKRESRHGQEGSRHESKSRSRERYDQTTATAPLDDSIGSSVRNAPRSTISDAEYDTHRNSMSPERIHYFKEQLLKREGLNQWTPLMIASTSAPPSVIALLLKVCGEACGIPDKSGSLPLHLVVCWRRSKMMELRGVEGRDITIIPDDLGDSGRISKGSKKRNKKNKKATHMLEGRREAEYDKLQTELCQVICLLIAAHPNSLATMNRWRQTPLHSLFEGKQQQQHAQSSAFNNTSSNKNEGLSLLETLLGKYDDKNQVFNSFNTTPISNTHHQNNPHHYTNFNNSLQHNKFGSNPSDNGIEDPSPNMKQLIQSAVYRSLRARDTKGRLALHCAVTCTWVSVEMLRTLIQAFPASAYIPVVPPPYNANHGGSARGSSHRGASPAGSSNYEWDISRNAVIPEEINILKGKEDGSDGLFPKSGGCYGKDLAVHLLHKRFVTPLASREGGGANMKSSFTGSLEDAELWSNSGYSQHTDASVFLNEDHCAAICALLEPLVQAARRPDNLEARLACAATGSGGANGLRGANTAIADENAMYHRSHSFYSTPSLTTATLLPLHIAALHGVSNEILEGLCRAYPEGALTPMMSPLHYDRLNTLPIELLEEGRAGHEVNTASDTEFMKLSLDYFGRSDLLFSYFPEAVSSKKVVYCRDEARLSRFENLIKREVQRGDGEGLLSDMAGSVWLFLCRSDNSGKSSSLRNKRLPNFGAAIGRVLNGLDSHSVLRLNYLRTTSIPEGVRVPPLSNGRTILEEAKERAPSGSMQRMLEEHFFHSSIQSFLNARDALNYSATCRRAWTRGVRLLQPIARHNMDDSSRSGYTMDTQGKWKLTNGMCQSETSSQEEERGCKLSQPWQKLELPYTPSCTHTVFISCNVAYHSWDSEILSAEGGGLLVLSEDAAQGAVPELVVASTPVMASVGEQGDEGHQHPTTRIRFSFNHYPGHSYSLWYYGSELHTLTITNLTIRQLVYSCDYNGHNPLHVLLCEGDNPRNLKEQLTALIAAGFGSNGPIHYALKVGVLERTLRCLIEANPTALLDTDSERRTPLHAAFDSTRMPHLGIVQALLTSPGVNATHLKDASGKLPIHIAAENGAGEALLKLLVDAYVDGCYRRTDTGDLPLHLLVRSGKATQGTVELLIRPIIHNPTICAYPGSLGVNLPLHIAADYRCNYKIFEGLLSSYSVAAHTQRQLMQQPSDTAKGGDGGGRSGGYPQKKDAQCALEIFEEGRVSLEAKSIPKSSEPNVKKGSTQMKLGEADFNLRSDLIFVHNPNVPKSSRPYLTTYYKDEKDRIGRLAACIKREALQCSKKRARSEEAELTEMAVLAWCWMCSNDYYAGVINDIVHSLPLEAVRFLALIENPKSEPVQNTFIKDCSTPRCALIIKSRLSFLGRYVFDRDSAPLHKSEVCVILRAKDIGAMDSYLSIQTLLDASDPDIDDYSHNCGSVYAITGNTIEVDRFAHFARKIGLDQSEAIAQIEELLLDSNASSAGDTPNLKQCGVKKSVFSDFCKLHGIDDKGCRSVVIKFMRNKQSLELEKQCRDILCESGKSSHVVPILNQFSFEGDKGKHVNPNDFTRDLFGRGPPLMNLSGLLFGIVMPCANGDLRDIFYREGISSANLRDNARQVGQTLQALHEQGITYMNLQLKNVLRFGKQMVLSDFGSALFIKSIKGLNAIGGSAMKICPSILPPEMIAKIELSNRDSFDQLMRYWKYVHADANYLSALTPHERDAISFHVETREPKPPSPNKKNDGQSWKNEISALLETIRFEDLPHVLSKSTSFDHFCAVWERMRENYNLWEMVVRPRVDEEKQCVYMLKSFENRSGSPPRDVSALPYKLVTPSEKMDVWIFGIFIYELSSGGNPFHTGYQGDLRGVGSYSRLYEWDRSAAEKSVKEHVQDPLAQDLLCRILVPAEERLPSISAVLQHPFFSPKSLEAERFLEKVSQSLAEQEHEEMQLLKDNTVTVRKVTKAVSLMFDDSIEKYCKIAFTTDQIAFPCCLMVLPYTLNIDESTNRPIAAPNPRIISCAVRLGKCLLEINKATARLSFWLMMSAKMKGQDGNAFKSQMQEWLKRARYESCSHIAIEIVNGLGCEMSYAMICEEVLAYDGNISKAKGYMRDPIRAARREIKQNSDALSDLYQSVSYLYLVDEATMFPSCPPRKSQGTAYPIHLQPNPKLIANVLLPFMNIVVMKALARNRFEGLASLLGLPPSLGIPESWRSSEPGLLHNIADNSFSIEEFVTLQTILRKDDLNAFKDDASIVSQSYHSVGSAYDNASFLTISALGSANMDLSPCDPMIAYVPMAQLELLFRERDPDREFGNLRRVTSGSQSKSLGLWTNLEVINQMKSMVEVAALEEQLRELQLNLDETQTAAAKYASLLSRRNMIKKNMPTNAVSTLGENVFSFDNSFDEPSVESHENSLSEDDTYSRSAHLSSINEQQPQDERESPQKEYQEEKLEISTHRIPDPPLTDPGSKPEEPDAARAKKKMRKSKRRFRPWFTAC